MEGHFIKTENYKSTFDDLRNPIICYGKGKKVGYIERDIITTHSEWIDKWKIYTPRANNIGTELNDDNLNTFIGAPKTVCTESYLAVGAELDLDENACLNLAKYFKTRFVRFLHSLAKASQDATSKTFKFVPLENFTETSSIDWDKSIEEIDQQLYAKYGLTQEEIDFIETMIKPMGD